MDGRKICRVEHYHTLFSVRQDAWRSKLTFDGFIRQAFFVVNKISNESSSMMLALYKISYPVLE
jgi:hypothetical protein